MNSAQAIRRGRSLRPVTGSPIVDLMSAYGRSEADCRIPRLAMRDLTTHDSFTKRCGAVTYPRPRFATLALLAEVGRNDPVFASSASLCEFMSTDG